jgi:nicotinamidase-related amidase
MALVVVDMQRYFCEPGHALGEFMERATRDGHDWYFDRVRNLVVPNVARLLEQFRSRDATVFFTEFGSRNADGSDLPLWARRHNDWCREHLGRPCYLPLADPASRVIDALAPAPGEPVIQKATSGPLAGTDIAQQLRTRGVETVVVAGVATSVCVLGMARELADSNFDVLVVADACATPGKDAHEAALALVSGSFGAVITMQGVSLAAV